MISLHKMFSSRKLIQAGCLGLGLVSCASANVLGPLSGGSGSTSWNASAFNIVTLGVLAGNLDGAPVLAGTFTSSSDIGGGVASFGNISDSSVTLTNGGVTVPYTDAFTIIDGGSAATTLKGCGTIYAPAGTSVSAVGCNGAAGSSTGNPTVTQSGLDFNFATARTSLETYSYTTLTTAPNQQSSSATSGNINITSPSTPGAVYLNLTQAALNGNGVNLVFNTSLVTAIFINVAGASISDSSSFQLSLNGVSLQNYSGIGGTGGNNFGGSPILFNFYQATSVTWSGNFYGSILAPFATVNAGGDLLGQGFFGQVANVGETHDDFFSGTNVPSTNISATPEPMTFALIGGGLLAIGALSRRKKK